MSSFANLPLEATYVQWSSDFLAYCRNFALYASLWVLGYLLVCLIVYFRYARRLPTRVRGSLKANRVLVVTAHPDDECMFMGPTIFRLCEQGAEVYLICLSNGDHEGKGNTRQEELWAACQELGIPGENICLIKDSRLPDNPKAQWPVPVVAKLLNHHLESLDIDTLVTFDRYGVSSHPNHCAIFYAVAFMFIEKLIPQRCTVYTLDSVSILRKYWGYLDLPLSFLLSSKRFWLSLCCDLEHNADILPAPGGDLPNPENACTIEEQVCLESLYFLRWTESRRIVRAMRLHTSQMVWFRRLYVQFSRYMVINTWRRISLADIELELEVDE